MPFLTAKRPRRVAREQMVGRLRYRSMKCWSMSEMGQKRKFSPGAHVVRFTPDSDQIADAPPLRICANNGLMQRSKRHAWLHGYSMTSSARARSAGGTVRPSTRAVLRLITRSNFVGCSTGRSLGFVPRKILSTYSDARLNRSGKFGP